MQKKRLSRRLFHKFIYQWGSAKYYRTGLRYHETYFYEMKNKKPNEQPYPWTEIADFGYLGIISSSLRQC